MKKIVLLLACLFLPVSAMGGTLDERIAALEKTMDAGIFNYVGFSGAIEVEAGYSSNYEDAKESDLDLATFELGVDVALNSYFSGFALMAWDAEEAKMDIDEGGITLGDADSSGFSLTAGKLYLPFGVYETALISDPLTLEIGETREGAARFDISAGALYAAAYAFNSAVNDSDGDDLVDAFGIVAGYGLELDHFGLDITAGWISNIMSSGGLAGYFADEGVDTLNEYTPGFALSAILRIADLTLIGEYVAVLNHDYLATAEDEPAAWNLEASYVFEVAGYSSSVAVAFQGTNETVFLGLPETRIATAAGVTLHEGVDLKLEWAHDKDYPVSDGGTGETSDTLTCQLALSF